MKKTKQRKFFSIIAGVAASVLITVPVSAIDFEQPSFQNSELIDIYTIAEGTVSGMPQGKSSNLTSDENEIDPSNFEVSFKILDEYSLPGYTVTESSSSSETAMPDNEAMDPITDSPSDVDTYELPNEAQPRAGVADLVVKDLTHTKHNTPFPLNTPIAFQFRMENIGSATATTPKFDIYINSTSLIGSGQAPSIAPGTGAVFEVTVGSSVAGTYSLTIRANKDRIVPESDYTNNQVAGGYVWGAATPNTGLVVYGFSIEGNQTSVLAGTDIIFNVAIQNTSNKNFTTGVPYKFEILSGSTVVVSKTMTSANIPAFSIRKGIQIGIHFNIAGNYTIRLTILNPEGYTDPYPSDNVKSLNITVRPSAQFDTHFLGGANGKYPYGTSLTVEIAKNVDSVSPGEITNAAGYWNNLSPNISFKSVESGTNLGRMVRIDQQLQKSTSSLVIAEAGSQPFPDGPYTYGEMTIYSDMMNKFMDKNGYTASERRTGCVSHEFGHILGLDHANCTSDSIMAANITDANYSPVIEDHDVYNLRARYS